VVVGQREQAGALAERGLIRFLRQPLQVRAGAAVDLLETELRGGQAAVPVLAVPAARVLGGKEITAAHLTVWRIPQPEQAVVAEPTRLAAVRLALVAMEQRLVYLDRQLHAQAAGVERVG